MQYKAVRIISTATTWFILFLFFFFFYTFTSFSEKLYHYHYFTKIEACFFLMKSNSHVLNHFSEDCIWQNKNNLHHNPNLGFGQLICTESSTLFSDMSSFLILFKKQNKTKKIETLSAGVGLFSLVSSDDEEWFPS